MVSKHFVYLFFPELWKASIVAWNTVPETGARVSPAEYSIQFNEVKDKSHFWYHTEENLYQNQ